MTRGTALLALLLILFGAPNGARANCSLGRLAELPVTMRGKVPIVTVQINDVDVHLIAESGDFFSLLTKSSAKRLGLELRPFHSGWECPASAAKPTCR